MSRFSLRVTFPDGSPLTVEQIAAALLPLLDKTNRDHNNYVTVTELDLASGTYARWSTQPQMLFCNNSAFKVNVTAEDVAQTNSVSIPVAPLVG